MWYSVLTSAISYTMCSRRNRIQGCLGPTQGGLGSGGRNGIERLHSSQDVVVYMAAIRRKQKHAQHFNIGVGGEEIRGGGSKEGAKRNDKRGGRSSKTTDTFIMQFAQPSVRCNDIRHAILLKVLRFHQPGCFLTLWYACISDIQEGLVLHMVHTGNHP